MAILGKKIKASRMMLLLLAGILLAAAIFTIVKYSKPDRNLDEVHQWVAAQFPEVTHMEARELASRDKKDIILFDVRQEGEYAVSHIDGAKRVDPAMDAEEFMARFGGALNGKTVIFYCSVGYRSSQLANRVKAALRKQGAKASYNLAGGIFGWHNGKHSLVSGPESRPTNAIHPYDPEWGRLIDDQSAVTLTAGQ